MAMNLGEYLNLDDGERSLYDWQFRNHGSFFMALWEAISKADTENLNSLSKAFPKHVAAYKRYIGEDGYWSGILYRVGRR